MADIPNPAGNGFLVEDFIGSITTQLDRVQDALRIKAVNRPLTYALKELHLDLKVFVDMDPNGQVRLRASGPNEAGASTLAMDFTTITKPMIEENTISLAATRSTPLEKLGLSTEEQLRLERLGVSNLAQLDRLKSSTGVSTVARMADVPLERLRRALQTGTPRLGPVAPTPSPSASPVRPPRAAPAPATPRPPVAAAPRPAPRPPRLDTLPPRPLPVRAGPKLPLGIARLQAHEDIGEPDALHPADAQALDAAPFDSAAPSPGNPTPVLAVPPLSRRLAISGSHLLHEAYPPQARLNGQELMIDELDDDRLVVRLPHGFEEGVLDVSLGDEATYSFALVHAPTMPAMAEPDADPWAPQASAAPGERR